MAKEKVYKLAQEFKVSSEALVQMLRTMGIPVKSHMSTVDENLRSEIKKRFESERAEIKKEYERKRQKLARAREDLEAPSAQQPAADGQAAGAGSTAESAAAPGTAAAAAAGASEKPGDVRRGPVRDDRPAPREGVRDFRDGRPPRDPRDVRPAYRTSSGIPGRDGVVARDYRTRPEDSRVGVGTGPRPPRPPMGPRPAGSTKPPGRDGGSAERGPSGPGGPRRRKGHRKGRTEKVEVDEGELKANVRRTLAQIGAGAERRKYRRDRPQDEAADGTEKKLLNVSEFVTVSDLANMMHVPTTEVIAKCLELGLFVTVNQRLDFETIALLSDEFGYTAQLMAEYTPEPETVEEIDDPTRLTARAPVVTVMGHVDHGKTSLLDYIRKTNVIAGEAGGITQHIAAYEVQTAHGPVTFLDTPGHEAFTAMRARGSQITDVVVLVVAADNGVMPQTKEAIDHARAANVPIVVAINKIDLPVANADKVRAELAQYGVLVEEYGGKVSCVEISALTGKGIEKLLETLALEAEILELKANPASKASGVVVEAELDKGKGPIATVLVQSGTLRRGDPFITGMHHGRVRELQNERGQAVTDAGPSRPVVVLGLSGTPQAGDSFRVVEDEKTAREIAARRRLAQREREMRHIGAVSLDHLHEHIRAGKVQSLNLIIKGDVDGSVEALASSLERLSNDEIKLRVIHKSVGAIKEADIMLAEASNALIIGFHLSPNPKIREFAKREGVEIRLFRIIYEAVDAIKKAMEGLLAPEIKENVIGQIEIRKVFRISKVGSIAGCMVLDGRVSRHARARLIRDDVEIADTTISSLKRNQDDAREVQAGYECGLSLQGYNDYKEGDRVEVYEQVEVARTLA